LLLLIGEIVDFATKTIFQRAVAAV